VRQPAGDAIDQEYPAGSVIAVPRVAELRMVLEQWYDPRRAESWDAVGLVCGDPDDNVGHVLLAVDAVPATVAEAMRVGAELLVSHHPLLLTPVHGVPADDPKGALVHRMIRARIAHYVAHTNADAANPGVSDALGDLLGLANLRPLEPHRFDPDDKLVVFVPLADLVRVVDALAAAGAGRIGNYERCAWSATGIGTFRPEPAATPFTGQVGAVSEVAEARVEMVVPRGLRGDVLQALRAAHPYEEPAFDLYARLPEPAASIGIGRVGELPSPTTLRGFVDLAAHALPPTTWGLRASGRPDRPVRTVAVCGGSGGSLVEAARAAGADAYLTADLRHHPAVEAVSERGADAMGLVDAAHWATEAPWLSDVAARLRTRFAGEGLKVTVSAEITDPWTLHAPSPGSSLT
jgi:dinuclear metal center YbgI/SA1388 family protein